MLTYQIFRSQNEQGMILKVTENSMSYSDTKKTHRYFFLWIKTGYWYKLDVCPNYTEKDHVAINQMEYITEKGVAPSIPPVDDWYERTIRDHYLPNVTGDNFPLLDYKGWTIWYGYNDTDARGYYFVCDEDGEDIGTSDYTIKDAMKTIDNVIKSEEK